ncbi:FG-GAP repeat domain-containing protein [Streptomyces sp. NPDC015220]|uniref:FG-GAP repeat domain-containing protein n=1 Tax=Streptomyces sp. NPDC015220 TaxID=3364947 RepID=UPI0036F64188
MRIARRHRTAIAVAALGAGVGLTPLQSASADPAAASIAVGVDHRIDLWGPAANVDITVTAPPATDGYIRLELPGNAVDNLHFTDDAGQALPLASAEGRQYLLIGAEDSDHNGVAGAPLADGVIHLHVSADYSTSRYSQLFAYLIDGTTNKAIASSTSLGSTNLLQVDQPYLSTQWQTPQGAYQDNTPVEVTTGAGRPVQEKLHIQMSMTAPPPSTRTRIVFSSQEIAAAGYTAMQLADAVTVGYSADGEQYSHLAWTVGDDGSLSIDLPALDGWGSTGQRDQYLSFSATWGLPAGALRGSFEVRDAQGRQYAGRQEDLTFTADVVPSFARAAYYGRDSAGVLWQYQADPYGAGNRRTARTKVGGGWQSYNVLSKLSALKADGTGDLVARDASGVLWYYQGTGHIKVPFSPRRRVGAGWQTYTTLTGAGDLTGDGHPDLLARDHDGILWLYKGTGNPAAPFAARTRIGGGWNTYTALIGATDTTGDGRPDLLARDHDGILWLYKGTGNPAAPFTARTRIGGGWNTYTFLASTHDTNNDGRCDLLAIDHDGVLWLYAGTGNPAAPFAGRVKAGTGWNIYNTLI